jgi:hypothetical protein
MDSFTKSGATRIASQIQLYWTLRGVSGVEAWIRTVPDCYELYEVRSNIAERLNVNSKSKVPVQGVSRA